MLINILHSSSTPLNVGPHQSILHIIVSDLRGKLVAQSSEAISSCRRFEDNIVKNWLKECLSSGVS